MRILGIDPGTATTGYGVIDVADGQKYTLVECGLVSTPKELEHGVRLNMIFEGVGAILAKHKPEQVAIERLFFASNATTAIAVGQAIGVTKLAIHKHNVPVFDYTPMQVKLVIGGSGKADKTVMKAVIKKMFKLREKKGMRTHFDNTADALAIAVCHARKTGL